MKERKLIKVCGMRHPENILEVARLRPDMMGFILYPPSRRFVGFDFRIPAGLPETIEKVGVFVDMTVEKVLAILSGMELNTAQLHGRETPSDCRLIREKGYKVLKAFGMVNDFGWNQLEPYIACCDGFIFDTSTPDHGGSGKKFNWAILGQYPYVHPFLLSGGIGPGDIAELENLTIPAFNGVDINSRFELEPGLKDIPAVQTFIQQFRKHGEMLS